MIKFSADWYSKAVEKLNQNTKKTEVENTFTPKKKLKIAKTIYPNGQKQMSLNGKEEWYGLQG